MQLAVQLPSLSREHGRNNPHRLIQCQEHPVEGPHKGGASHLRDKVRVDVQVNVHIVDDDGPLVTDADNISEAFR